MNIGRCLDKHAADENTGYVEARKSYKLRVSQTSDISARWLDEHWNVPVTEREFWATCRTIHWWFSIFILVFLPVILFHRLLPVCFLTRIHLIQQTSGIGHTWGESGQFIPRDILVKDLEPLFALLLRNGRTSASRLTKHLQHIKNFRFLLHSIWDFPFLKEATVKS